MIESAAAFESLKAAFDLTKTILEASTSAKLNAQLIQLQAQILEGQSKLMAAMQSESALAQRVKQLEQQLVDLERFDADSARYPLVKVGTGTFAHVGPATDDPASPEVWLCAPCFQRHKRAILQYKGRTANKDEALYGCPDCKAVIQVSWTRGPGKAPPEKPAAGV